MASQNAQAFIRLITQRRSVYALSNKQVVPDQQLLQLVRTALREAPSPFNSQSSRAAVLLGQDHTSYWKEMVPQALNRVAGAKAVEASQPKLDGFAAGYGTVLFYEALDRVKAMQNTFPTYAESFPVWSRQSSGMAQIYAWSLLEAEGFGANLQHYGNLTSQPLAHKYRIPSSWQLQAEMVFGHPEKPAGEKTYMPDEERVLAFGEST